MAKKNLKDSFKQAAEIAKDVPETMHAVAFNRALDALLKEDTKGAVRADKNGKTRRVTTTPKTNDSSGDEITTMLQQLDRTAHPEIPKAQRVLDRSLHLLRIAKDVLEIDGLSSTQIAKVLTKKFRLKTTHQAVRQALDKAGDKADRVSAGNGATRYRIMAPGEEYLDKGHEEVDRKPARRSTRRAKATHAQKKTLKKKAPQKAETAKARSRRPSSRPGPKAMLRELAATGFFKTPKMIADIQVHLEKKKGHKYKTNELSASLLRLLRDLVIDRDKNPDGQYEYKAS